MELTKISARPVILFDLDGTLLPMDMKAFERAYFKGLSEIVPEFEMEELVRLIWSGTKEMVLNDGTKPNAVRFAEKFTSESGIRYEDAETRFMDYYAGAFNDCAAVCPITDTGRDIVKVLQQKGYTVAVATNPIFPEIAMAARLRWVGLDIAQFPRVSTFENSSHAKPNPEYYREFCEKLGAKPEDCIMIGNDVEEDGIARSLGIEVMLVTDCLLNKKSLPYDDYPTGTLLDVLAWAKSLPDCAS